MGEIEETRYDTSSNSDNESNGDQNIEASDPISIAKIAGVSERPPRFLVREKFIPTKARIKHSPAITAINSNFLKFSCNFSNFLETFEQLCSRFCSNFFEIYWHNL